MKGICLRTGVPMQRLGFPLPFLCSVSLDLLAEHYLHTMSQWVYPAIR